jgi:hypothetical protein
MAVDLNNFSKRDQRGFTLSFAVVLCVIFAGLLYTIFYFLKINIRESDAAIFREKAIYLAESGNNRAMARFNVKTLPDTEGLDFDDDDDDDFDDFDDDDFFEDDFFDEFDEDFEDDELDELFDEDDKVFLTKIPRYINFYLIKPFFVNIDTGAVITEAAYFGLVAQQQARIEANKQRARDEGDEEEYQSDEILIEELYFPLPEVNVSKIGTIPIKKGVHLKPGFKITLAEKVPVEIKQASIVNEYYNLVPEFTFKPARAKLTAISPNYARPGDYLDIRFAGQNLDDGSLVEFSSSDIALLEYSSGTASVGLNEKAKPGRIEIKLGANKSNFFIVPIETDEPTPIITQVLLPKPDEAEVQFIKIGNKDSINNIKIVGDNLSLKGLAPVIVPDSDKIIIDVISYKENELVINVETKKASIGLHYFSIFTEGGQSSSWAFNVEKIAESIEEHNPDIGSYTTVATLLEVLSLANLPIRSFIEASSGGRPGDGSDEGESDSGRPGSATSSGKGKRRTFDLLRSDLELVWQLETIATINKKSFKETRIVRRAVPRAEAGLTTNSELSFSQSSIIFEGYLEALTLLQDPSSSGDTEIFVEGEDPDADSFESRSERPELLPTGSAVVEDFFLQKRGQSPSGKGFTKGGIVTIVSSNSKGTYSDYAFVTGTGPDSISVKEPGFNETHFSGDEVIQFTPAIITPARIREGDAQRNIDPPGAVAYIPNRVNFEYVFRTKLEKLASWGGGFTTSTKVPDDFDEVFEGYFGMTIISGVPSYTGSNSLYGQGLLIIDTTKGGQNPSGSTVTLGGSSKLPSMFEGVIYIIGDLNISGPVELSGAIIVNSPRDNSTMRISGTGNVSYNQDNIRKAIVHIPFTDDLRSRIIEPSSGQSELLGDKKK